MIKRMKTGAMPNYQGALRTKNKLMFQGYKNPRVFKRDDGKWAVSYGLKKKR